jgi:hypothetical protein
MQGKNLAGAGALVGAGLGSLKKSPQYLDPVNRMSASHSSELGFGSGAPSEAFMQKQAERDAKHKAVGSALTTAAGAAAMIPGVGWIASGVLGLAGGLTSAGVFKSKKKEQREYQEDQDATRKMFSNLTADESLNRRADILSSDMYAKGGYTNEYLDLFGMGGKTEGYAKGGYTYANGGQSYPGDNPDPGPYNINNSNNPYGGTKDVYSITGGGTHEESPTGGTTISHDPDGTPNKAEEGEVVAELANGQFVFTNRF